MIRPVIDQEAAIDLKTEIGILKSCQHQIKSITDISKTHSSLSGSLSYIRVISPIVEHLVKLAQSQPREAQEIFQTNVDILLGRDKVRVKSEVKRWEAKLFLSVLNLALHVVDITHHKVNNIVHQWPSTLRRDCFKSTTYLAPSTREINHLSQRSSLFTSAFWMRISNKLEVSQAPPLAS
jgi:hypothetical protein